MKRLLLAAVAAVILAGGAANAADPSENLWRLWRNTMVPQDDGQLWPAVLVATFDERRADGTLDDNYNRGECEIIRGLVIRDNATRQVQLEYSCIYLPRGIRPKLRPAVLVLPQ